MFGTFAVLYRVHHGFGFFRGSAEGLLAEDHLAGLGRGNRDLGVSVIRAGDINEVNIFTRNQSAPVGLYRLIAPVLSKSLYAVRVARTDCFQHRTVGQIEKTGGLQERIRMGAPHESVADDPDIQFFFDTAFFDTAVASAC